MVQRTDEPGFAVYDLIARTLGERGFPVTASNENDGGAIILVVHDVEETRDGVEAVLQSDGYRVNPARTKKRQ